jgi:hypothetical protein
VNRAFSRPQGCRARDLPRDTKLGTRKDNCADADAVDEERKASLERRVRAVHLIPV